MTEAEAKQKWCPFSRVIHFHDNDSAGNSPAAGNRGCHGTPKVEAYCIGSACMAWREEFPHGSQIAQSHGYCGLAGKP